MNKHIADIQNSPDWRNIAVNRVGVRKLRYPIIFEENAHQPPQHSIAYFTMLVDLPKNVKGTHMSRFVELLNEKPALFSIKNLHAWLTTMTQRLQANNGYLQVEFPYFICKTAPVSQASSLMDYDISLSASLENQQFHSCVTLIIPITSLCPCSKEISDYGAHNQRSHVTLTLEGAPFSLKEIIQLVERKASCELYGILKRADEKAVTERAYDNPKFVEDLVRDIATDLETLKGIHGYKISSENFESIHNHSAYAEIDRLNISPSHFASSFHQAQHE